MKKSYYLLMYDIVETKRRTKLQKILIKQDWAMLQYSVYLKYTNMTDLRKLESRIENLIEDDFLDSIYYTKVHLPSFMNGMYAEKVRMYISESIDNVFI